MGGLASASQPTVSAATVATMPPIALRPLMWSVGGIGGRISGSMDLAKQEHFA